MSTLMLASIFRPSIAPVLRDAMLRISKYVPITTATATVTQASATIAAIPFLVRRNARNLAHGDRSKPFSRLGGAILLARRTGSPKRSKRKRETVSFSSVRNP